MRSWLAGRLAGGVLAVTALALAPFPAAGQTDPGWPNAVRVAQEGQSDSARAAVQRILAATPPTDTLYRRSSTPRRWSRAARARCADCSSR